MRSVLSNSSAHLIGLKHCFGGPASRWVRQFLLFLARRKRAWNSHPQPPLSRSIGPDTATSCSESQAVVLFLSANSCFRGVGLTLREGWFPLESSDEYTPNISHIFNSQAPTSFPCKFFDVRT